MTDTKTASKFVISRTFNAPLDRVWKAWTEPEQMAQWWGPKGFEADVKTLDLEPGGTFHYRLQSPQGQEMWGRMLFREIVPKKRLVFINSFSDPQGGVTRHPMAPDWPLLMHTTISFAEANGKTTVTVEWIPYEASEAERETFEQGRESMQAGWTGTFEKLEHHLEKS
ncbi:MAG: SRPBCC domain-containing protein [Hyphomicrobiales bacterium]